MRRGTGHSSTAHHAFIQRGAADSSQRGRRRMQPNAGNGDARAQNSCAFLSDSVQSGLAGRDTPAHVDGRSILPLARGEDNVSWREFLHGEQFLNEDSNQWLTDGREEGFVQNGELAAGQPQGPTLVDAGRYRER